MQRSHQSVWTHYDWSFRELVVVLLDAFEVIARCVCLADGARGKVHDLISVPHDIRVQLCDTKVCPVASNHSKNVAQTVRSFEKDD